MALGRDAALVLRRTAFGESSLVIQALTRTHGRVHFLAKGAYRHTSSYYCVLDFFDELSIEWSSVKDRELGTLRRAEITTRRRTLCSDPARYRSGVEILELCELAAQPGDQSPRLFDLASQALDALEDRSNEALAVLVVFELRFLQNLGLAPSLRRCASCGGEAPTLRENGDSTEQRVAFSAGAGGRLCLDCARDAKASGRRVGTLPEQLVENASRLGATGLEAARELSREALAGARTFTERFMDYHLETRPKSRRGQSTLPRMEKSRR